MGWMQDARFDDTLKQITFDIFVTDNIDKMSIPLTALRPIRFIISSKQFLKGFKNSNEILKNKENKMWLFISCLSRFDIPDIDSLILIKGDGVSSNQHLYGGRRHIFDWPTQHPTVTWAALCSPLFGAFFPFFFFCLDLLKWWGVESWGERKKEGGVTMANISVGWGRTLQHKWHMFRLYVCVCISKGEW